MLLLARQCQILAVIGQVDLLANVGALLADTQSLLTRLQDGDSADANDGDFFAADPSISPGREASPAPNAAAELPPDEVATDEVYDFEVRPHTPCEHTKLDTSGAHLCHISTDPSGNRAGLCVQFREEEDGPFCTRLLGEAGSRSWGGHAAVRKEDVVLPPEGGWQWTSDWQVMIPFDSVPVVNMTSPSQKLRILFTKDLPIKGKLGSQGRQSFPLLPLCGVAVIKV